MCRLFGFRSSVSLRVHHSLVAAENALGVQSRAHPDGWGVGFYEDDHPRVIKDARPAFDDAGFVRISQMITSSVVIAHIRRATVGQVGICNTHPFQLGPWLFAHNGTVEGFSQLRPFFIEEIDSDLLPHLTGNTDSEHCFLLLLTELERMGCLIEPTASQLCEALEETLRRIDDWSRILGTEPPIMNFLVTNGVHFAATRFGRRLFFSTQKRQMCSDYERCPSASRPCLGPQRGEGPLTHLAVASEPISQEDLWEELPDNVVCLVDNHMDIHWRNGVVENPRPRARTAERL